MKKQTLVQKFEQYKTNLLLYSIYHGVDDFYDKLALAVDTGTDEDIKVAARRLMLEVPTNAPKISGWYILEGIGGSIGK